MHPLFSLAGKTALISGAGSREGIGMAAARVLAELGARVVLVSTTGRIFERAAELQAEGHDAHGFVCNLSERAAVCQLAAAIAATLGTVDILVNNAGMTQLGASESFALFHECEDADWDTAIERNLGTCYNATRAFLPAMVAQGWGRVVNVSSVTGPLVSNPGEAAYSAAKAAMVGMSRSIALDVARFGVTINNVAPGWVATASQSAGEQQASRHTPLGRAGTPMEMAGMIAFLASPGASYITGQMMVIDGGNCLQESKGA